jgi:hypothetical protein
LTGAGWIGLPLRGSLDIGGGFGGDGWWIVLGSGIMGYVFLFFNVFFCHMTNNCYICKLKKVNKSFLNN